MKWKKKEKELTPEEAIELAKQELMPLWDWGLPLLAAVRDGETARAYPLDPSFMEKNWILFSVDPASYSGETVFQFIDEWLRRYSTFNFSALGIVSARYPFLKNKHDMEKSLTPHEAKYPIVLDQDGNLQKAYLLEKTPSFRLIEKGRPFFSANGLEGLMQVELGIHDYLRRADPGLSLRPVYRGTPEDGYDSHSIFFRSDHKDEIQRVSKIPSPQHSGVFYMVGDWTEMETHALTRSPTASLEFELKMETLGIIAESNATMAERARIFIEIDGVPVPDTLAGRDLEYDDGGSSYLEIRQGRLYSAITRLPADRITQVTLKFPLAAKMPVSLHGIRFSRPFEQFLALHP